MTERWLDATRNVLLIIAPVIGWACYELGKIAERRQAVRTQQLCGHAMTGLGGGAFICELPPAHRGWHKQGETRWAYKP